MKLPIDENLSDRLCQLLQDEYPDSLHIKAIGYVSAGDLTVWRHAREHELVIVTKDSDFPMLSAQFGHPPKVVWIRLGNCPTTLVAQLLRSQRARIETFVHDPVRSVLAIGYEDLASSGG